MWSNIAEVPSTDEMLRKFFDSVTTSKTSSVLHAAESPESSLSVYFSKFWLKLEGSGGQKKSLRDSSRDSDRPMYVEEVIIDGFKSYSMRTTVGPFDPQFTAITGLNGSSGIAI